MIRVAVSVEGETEEKFVKEVLCNHFAGKNIYFEPINLRGYKTYSKIKKEINSLIKSFDFVTTLYDYYGLERIKDFAGLNFDSVKNQNCFDKVETIEKAFENDINNQKFIPYIQLHEFEAFIYVEPEITVQSLLGCNKSEMLRYIKQTKEEFDGNPELINNSTETAPSKRIKKIYPGYQKPLHGAIITSNLGINRIMNDCPRFKCWIEKLESLQS